MVMHQLGLRRTRARRTVFFLLSFCLSASFLPTSPTTRTVVDSYALDVSPSSIRMDDAIALVSLSVAQLHCSI